MDVHKKASAGRTITMLISIVWTNSSAIDIRVSLTENNRVNQVLAIRLLDDIEKAIRTGEPKRVHRAAHSIKGSLNNLRALTAVQVTMELETLGHNGT